MTKDEALLAWATAHAATKAAEGDYQQAHDRSNAAWRTFIESNGSDQAREALWQVYLRLAVKTNEKNVTYYPLVQATNDAWDAYAQAVLDG